MNPAVIQTVWADVLASTLRDAGISLCVISPGSRSTPLVCALERCSGFELVTIIDERAAAFYALGAARATGKPAALVCTSGSAAAHYLPAIVEASHAGVPLIALTADRPPELHGCGASQTIDQRAIYGGFVRAAFELGAPVGEPLALRAIRRQMIQAVTLALGPDPGPVHVNIALKKPLEPAQPSTDDERAFVAVAQDLVAQRPLIAPPTLAPDAGAIDALARAIAAEPRGVIVAGALPASFAASRDAIFEVARRSGYPIVAEAGSQLRLCARPDDVAFVDSFDLIATRLPTPAVIVQLGAEPVAAAWPAFLARARDTGASRWVLAGPRWMDSDSSADGVLLGDVARSVRDLAVGLALAERTSASSLRRRVERDAASLAWRDDWRALDQRGRDALDRARHATPSNEIDTIADAIASLPTGAVIQVGNSLPIRTIDHASAQHLGTLPIGPDSRSEPRSGERERAGTLGADPAWHAGLHGLQCSDNTMVITQRGAAGIDGLIASAAGATRAGRPVLLVLGDVSFAHDIGGLLAARAAVEPLAILVIDNAGGRIFEGLPIGNAKLGEAFDRHWLTAPNVDVSAVATALGARAQVATTPTAIANALGVAFAATPATTSSRDASLVTVIHVPVSPTGARDVRAAAIALVAGDARPSRPAIEPTAPRATRESRMTIGERP